MCDLLYLETFPSVLPTPSLSQQQTLTHTLHTHTQTHHTHTHYTHAHTHYTQTDTLHTHRQDRMVSKELTHTTQEGMRDLERDRGGGLVVVGVSMEIGPRESQF